MIDPCVFDAVNKELRTVPAYFTRARVYTGYIPALGIDVGATIAPGNVLGALHWDDGSSVPLVAPPGCYGRITRFGAIAGYRVHRRPSQVILLLA